MRLAKAERQRGVVLVISLVLLVTLTLIGFTATMTVTSEHRMAGNAQQRQIAFQAAEGGLRGGETWLGQQIEEPGRAPATCTTGCTVWDTDVLVDHSGGGSPVYTGYRVADLWTNKALTDEVSVANASYVIEYVDARRDSLQLGQQQDVGPGSYLVFYRVVARGEGVSSGGVVLASSYSRRF